MLPDWITQLGLVGWPLAACSVMTCALGLERAVFTTRAYWHKERNYQALAQYLDTKKVYPKPIRDEMISLMLRDLEAPYYSGIKSLRIIGAISPMLGLLGTVLGIIAAFQVIAQQTGAVTPNIIADGLWEALLTTAIGLMIALPALVMAHVFRHLNEQCLQGFCHRLNQLSLSFETNALHPAGARPTTVSLEQAV